MSRLTDAGFPLTTCGNDGYRFCRIIGAAYVSSVDCTWLRTARRLILRTWVYQEDHSESVQEVVSGVGPDEPLRVSLRDERVAPEVASRAADRGEDKRV